MALSFWVNAYQGSQFYNGSTPSYVNLTEAQWRSALSKWFPDVDSVERTEVGLPDADWIDTPDGQYWYGTGPGTFAPGSPGTQGAAVTNTAAQGDTSVGP